MADQKFQNSVQIKGKLKLPNELKDKALVINNLGEVAPSVVTTTELSYVSGVTSPIQTQLAAKADLVGGKVPAEQLPSYVDDVLEFASLNAFPTPGEQGKIYVALDTNKTYRWSGSTYIEVSPSEVTSVNGQSGAVVLDTDDINEGLANLYFTAERAQDSVGTILLDSATIDLTYDDAAPSITAAVKDASLSNQHIAPNAAIDATKIANGSVSNVEFQYLDGVTSSIQSQLNAHTTEDLTFVKFDGSRPLTGDLNANNHKVINLANPTLDQDAATKFYVDSAIANIPMGSAGDIYETSAMLLNNQTSPANITGLAFSASVVRSFKVLLSIEIDAASDLYESFELVGINKNGSFDMAVSSVGDDTNYIISITSAGQVQYTSPMLTGFVSAKAKYRAITTSVM